MTAEQLHEEQIFNVARRIPDAGARQDYLSQVCADDGPLRRRIERLLQAHEDTDFMSRDTAEVPATIDQPISEAPGMVIGRYKLLEKIGEGGFGIVFVAEQQTPVRRAVALKIIKPGMDTKEVVARFEAERQALAIMNHPNIAHVFDGGVTDSGRSYFVMELVRGVPITEFCDANNLSLEERLQLFLHVCYAVQHAHQKGVIHRDLKPLNVLVTLQDARPVVKVIDFGISKAISQPLTERTLYTARGQMVGTPQYMSPEQAGGSGMDVDTRSDVYSLGIILYELLAGSTPLQAERLKGISYADIQRAIQEEEPQKPSVRLNAIGDELPAVAMHRSIDARRLRQLVRGDLDWIVMKALEKDRSRRYETASALADDVLRHLNHQTIEASRPSLFYRTRKFVRRNRSAVAATSVVVLLLAVTGLFIWKAGESEDARRNAEEARLQEKRDRDDRDWVIRTIPKIRQQVEEGDFEAAFELAGIAQNMSPDNKDVRALWQAAACSWSVVIDPPGAEVYVLDYKDVDGQWVSLGKSPVELELARGFRRFRITSDGYETVEGCAGPDNVKLQRKLDKRGALPTGMVRVSRAESAELPGDWMVDRYEVTNRQYKQFVDDGGYEKREYWKHPIRKEQATIDWQEAIVMFCDQTGKPGPSTWADGTYPPGEDSYPVRGISWYEAAAYACYAQKSLPTIHHWRLISGGENSYRIAELCNLNAVKPLPVETLHGLGPFGTYGTAGNVKEWCWNEGLGDERYVAGGAWHEGAYEHSSCVARSALDRSETLGVRCAKYLNDVDPKLLAVISKKEPIRDPRSETPLSDEAFEMVTRLYTRGDRKPLNADITLVSDTPLYRHELAVFDGVRDKDRVSGHLLLPKGVAEPYQVVVYFPGYFAFETDSFPEDPCDPLFAALLNDGRAIFWPIYSWTYGRKLNREFISPDEIRRETRVHTYYEMCRSLDFLEGHPQIDASKLAYMGFSYGAALGPLFLGLEKRFDAAVLLLGGAWVDRRLPPECDPFHFAPRVSVPILMVNGENDHYFPGDISQEPLFKYLGSKIKEHRVFPGGHGVTPDILARETIGWLDQHFGSVTRVVELPEVMRQREAMFTAKFQQSARNAQTLVNTVIQSVERKRKQRTESGDAERSPSSSQQSGQVADVVRETFDELTEQGTVEETSAHDRANALYARGRVFAHYLLYKDAAASYRDFLGIGRQLADYDQQLLAEALYWLGVTTFGNESEGYLRECMQIRERTASFQDSRANVDLLLNLARSILQQNRPEEALEFAQQSVAMFKRLGAAPNEAQAWATAVLADCHRALRKYAVAKEEYEEAIGIFRKLGDWHGVEISLSNLAIMLQEQRQLVEAEAALRESLKMSRLLEEEGKFQADRMVDVLSRLAEIHRLLRDPAEAESLLRACLEEKRRLSGSSQGSLLATQFTLFETLRDQGKESQADTVGREFVSAFKSAVSEEKTIWGPLWDRVTFAALLAWLSSDEPALERSLQLLDEVISLQQTPDPAMDRTASFVRSVVYSKKADFAQSILCVERSMHDFAPKSDMDAIVYHQYASHLVALYRKTGDLHKAEQVLRESLRLSTCQVPESHAEADFARADLAEVLIEQSKFDEAEELLILAQERLLKHPVVSSDQKRKICGMLAHVLDAKQKPVEADKWRTRCNEFSESSPDGHAKVLAR